MNASVFALPAFALWLPSGYSWGAVLLLAGALVHGPRWIRSRPDARTCWLALAFVFLAALSVWGSDVREGSKRLEEPLKCLLAVPCLLFAVRFAPHSRMLFAGLLLGCIGAGGIAVWQVFHLGMVRASGYTNAIQFGDLALLMSVMVAIFTICLYSKLSWVWRLGGLLAIGAGLWACMLAQARGAWLALAIALVLGVLVLPGTSRMVIWKNALLLGAMGLCILWASAGMVTARLSAMQHEMASYRQQGNADTSIGQRLEHWRFAWKLGAEKPLTGWGEKAYLQEKQKRVGQGAFHAAIAQFTHAHNELLDTFAKRGLIGVAGLLLVYAIPMVLFWPSTQAARAVLAAPHIANAYHALCLMGVGIPAFYAGFGLTQVFFSHNSGIMFYLFMLSAVWASLRGLQGKGDHGGMAPLAAAQALPPFYESMDKPAGGKNVSSGSEDAVDEHTAVAVSHSLSKPRVLHFVTGGFSGATQVATDLVRAHLQSGNFEPLLVLRRKWGTSGERVQVLREQGLDVRTVTGVAHAATIRSLAHLCREFQPDILVAHGFSEHLWGRYAGLLAKVPHMVHVEHNSRERYSFLRLKQALWLAQYTDRIVGCSEGVRQSLLALGFAAEKIIAIPNGIHLDMYAQTQPQALSQRSEAIVMPARFARQKDHETLIRAVALLRDRGRRLPVLFVGGGKAFYLRKAKRLAVALGVQDLVQFLGFRKDVPALLMSHRICALCTHYEGMPLALLEGMAAGCAIIGSDAPGVEEVIAHECNGLLVSSPDAQAWADALQRLLDQPAFAQRMAVQARQDAMQRHGLLLMTRRYEALFSEILAQSPVSRNASVNGHGA